MKTACRQSVLFIFHLGVVAVALAGCGHVVTSPPQNVAGGQWTIVAGMKVVTQIRANDCARAVGQMVAERWGKPWRTSLNPTDSARGISAAKLKAALEETGLQAFVIEATIDDLQSEMSAGRPVIAGVVFAHSKRQYGHYQVVVGIAPSLGKLLLIDPQRGYVVQPYGDFERGWKPAGHVAIVSAP